MEHRSNSWLTIALCLGLSACASPRKGSAGTESEAGSVSATDAGASSEGPNKDSAAAPEKLENIQIVVDGYGISHIYAPTDQAAFFGSGYAMARDRLFQMELIRRRALGQTAELFGDKSYKDDVGARTFNFQKLGEADYAATQQRFPEDAKLVDAFTAGINLFITQIRDGKLDRPYGFRDSELGFLPEPWEPAHAFAVGKLLGFALSNTLDHDLLGTIVRKLANGFSDVVPLHLSATDAYSMKAQTSSTKARARKSEPTRLNAEQKASLSRRLAEGYRFFERASESNNWAVTGEHTQNGKPLLAGDPHQPTSSPSRLWPLHMSTKAYGGSLDVVGFAFAGTPSVQLGHNDRVGWTATTNFADVMDVWSIDISNGKARLGDERIAVVDRKESILVRKEGGALGDNETREITVREVPGHGVILPDSLLPVPTIVLADLGDEALLLNWTGFAPTTELSGYLGMDRATNRAELERAIDHMSIGASNFVCADAEGIMLHVHTDVPDRGVPSSHPMPFRVISAANSQNLWTRGLLGPDKLPHMVDPAAGFIATANNDPWGHTQDGDVENDAFYYGAYYAKGMRAQRITDMLTDALASGKKLGVEDMQQMQRDLRSPVADALIPVLAQALSDLKTRDDLSDFAEDEQLVLLGEQLVAWDRRMTRDSGAALAFLGLEWFAVKRAFGSRLGDLFFDPIAEKSPPYLLGQLVSTLRDRYEGAREVLDDDPSRFVLRALEDARDWLEDRYGHADLTRVTLGQHHAVAFDNSYGGAISAGRFAVPGGSDTVNVSEAPFFKGGDPLMETTSHQASLYRMVLTFRADGSTDSYLSMARGTSEDPASPHFDDLHQSWLDLEYFHLPFTRSEVNDAMEASYDLPWPQ